MNPAARKQALTSLNTIYSSLNSTIDQSNENEDLTEKLIDFKTQARVHYKHVKGNKGRETFFKIIALIQRASQINFSFLNFDLSKEIVKHFNVGNLLCFRQISRKANKLADDILAERSKGEAKSYITNLKDAFEAAIKYNHLSKEIKKASFALFLSHFHYTSNQEKLKLFKNVGFLGERYKPIRNLICPVGLSSKFNVEFSASMNRLVAKGEENLFQFAINGFHYPHLTSTPLHFAAQLGNVEAVQYFIKNDSAAINQRGVHGATPLCFACGSFILYPPIPEESRLKIVELLLEAGADPTLGCTSTLVYRKTPLYFAIENNLVNIVKILLNTEVDPHIEIQPNSSAFSLAESKKEQSPDIWDLLKIYIPLKPRYL